MIGKVFEISDGDYAIVYDTSNENNTIYLTNYGIFNTAIMNKVNLQTLPEIHFNLENLKKIYKIWCYDAKFDTENITGDVIIYHGRKEYYVKDWNEFFKISKQYFF